MSLSCLIIFHNLEKPNYVLLIASVPLTEHVE